MVLHHQKTTHSKTCQRCEECQERVYTAVNSDKGTVGLSRVQSVRSKGRSTDNLRNRPNSETIQSFAWNGHTVPYVCSKCEWLS